MLLPCRHIFAVRNKLGIPLFDPVLASERWTTSYYRTTQRLFVDSSREPSLNVTEEKASKRQRTLSQHEKFRKASLLSSEIASVVSEVSNVHFHRRLKLLHELVDYWKSNQEVALIEVDHTDCFSEFSSDDETSNVQMDVVSSEVAVEFQTITQHVTELPPNIVTEDQTSKTFEMSLSNGNDEACCSQDTAREATRHNDTLLRMKVPPVQKKRGRPKGQDRTTIGLPTKRKKIDKGPQSFLYKHSTEKERIILSWFVDLPCIEKAIKGSSLIEEF